MSQDPVLNSSDEWGQFAKAFKKLLEAGVSTSTAEDLVRATNAAYPFASALTILDIGCGPGQVIAECDAADLSAFQDNSVSHALAGFVLFMVPNADVALKEIHRVLTDQNGGGVLALSSWEGSEWIDLMALLSTVRPDKQVPKMPKEWSTIEGIRGQLETAGFRNVDVHPSETFWPFDNYDETAQYLLTQFPIMRTLTAGMTKAELEEVQKLMVEDLKAKHPSLPSRMTGTALIGVGRK